jgi:hypothetical protein
MLAGSLWDIFGASVRLKYDKTNKIDALPTATY